MSYFFHRDAKSAFDDLKLAGLTSLGLLWGFKTVLLKEGGPMSRLIMITLGSRALGSLSTACEVGMRPFAGCRLMKMLSDSFNLSLTS